MLEISWALFPVLQGTCQGQTTAELGVSAGTWNWAESSVDLGSAHSERRPWETGLQVNREYVVHIGNVPNGTWDVGHGTLLRLRKCALSVYMFICYIGSLVP